MIRTDGIPTIASPSLAAQRAERRRIRGRRERDAAELMNQDSRNPGLQGPRAARFRRAMQGTITRLSLMDTGHASYADVREELRNLAQIAGVEY